MAASLLCEPGITTRRPAHQSLVALARYAFGGARQERGK